MNKKTSVIALLALAVVLCFTRFYSISVVIALALSSGVRPWRSSFFTSYITRFMVNILFFCSLTMLTGMYCWLAHLAIHPLFVLVPYGALYYWLYRRAPKLPRTEKSRGWVYEDIIAGILALVGVAVVVANFYLPHPSTAASVQIITNGYDNSAHLSLIQTTYDAKGYVYGAYDQVKDQITWKSITAYPQGWHLANAFLWRGTGAQVFGGSNVSLGVNFYVVTILAWQVLLLFIFTRASLWFAELLGLKKQLRRSGPLAAFVAINLLFQLLIFWGNLMFGFPTFVAALAYFVLLSVMILAAYDKDKSNVFICYLGALLASSVIGMAWLLPIPVTMGMVALGFGGLLPKRLLATMQTNWRQYGWYALGTFLLLMPLLLQVIISVRYLPDGAGHLNDDGGIYGISSLLAGLLILLTIATLLRPLKAAQAKLATPSLAIITPALLFMAAIFIYQLFSLGHTSYFFTKSLALSLVLIGLFTGPYFAQAISVVKFPRFAGLYGVLAAATIVGVVLACSGQETTNFNRLFQRNSKVVYGTATTIARLATNGGLVRQPTVVDTGLGYDADVIGSIFTISAPHKVDACAADAMWFINTRRPASVPAQLNVCTQKGPITVITAAGTKQSIMKLHNPKITIEDAS